MTNTELLAKIKAEIERRVDILATVSAKQAKDGDSEMSTYYHGKAVSLEELISFLSTLEKECEDFPTTDEEMAKFLATHPKVEVPEKYKTPDWMFDKSEKPMEGGLEEEIERYLHSLGVGYGGWVDGMEDDDLRGIARHFAQWQKEQMMKGAVEGEVYLYHSYNRDATAILVDIPKENLGDKVRVIVCKNEDEK